MSSFDYQKSTITKYRAGTSADPYIEITETKRVLNGQIQLNEIPVFRNKVKINNMFEVSRNYKKDLVENEYRVDYVEGMMYFHPSVEGSTLTYTFFGKGNHFISANRVWTKQKNGEVVETLGEIIDVGADAIGHIQDLSGLIDRTELAIENTTEAISGANQSAQDAQNKAQYAEAVGNSLVHKGDYLDSTAYIVRNIVYYNGSTYMCITNTTGNLPTDVTKWKKITNMIWKGIYSASTTYNFGDVVGDSLKENVYMCISDGTLNKALTTVANWTLMLSVADAILNVNTKATHAQTQGDYAKTQGDYAKSQAESIVINGTNLINRGTYNNTATYKPLNIVVYGSGVWQCLRECVGIEPTASNYQDWQLLMQSTSSVTWDSVSGRPDVEGHVANKSNPHDVTASQVGAYSKTESDNKYPIRANLLQHVSNNDLHIATTERTEWNAKETTTGAQEKATAAEVNAKLASVPRAGGLVTGSLDMSDVFPLKFKIPTIQSWVMHSSTTGTFHIVPSTSSDAEDWDFLKGIHITANDVLWAGGSLNDLKQSGVDAKNTVVAAVNAKNVATSTTDSWATVASKVGQIKTTLQMVKGVTSSNPFTIANLPFKPMVISVNVNLQDVHLWNGGQGSLMGFQGATTIYDTINGAVVSNTPSGTSTTQSLNYMEVTLTNPVVVFGNNSVSFSASSTQVIRVVDYIIFGI